MLSMLDLTNLNHELKGLRLHRFGGMGTPLSLQILYTEEFEILYFSFQSSPTIRRIPHPGVSLTNLRISSIMCAGVEPFALVFGSARRHGVFAANVCKWRFG